MAKMIPAHVSDKSPNSERMVFGWFSSDQNTGVVMHSLLQKNHQKKMIAEVDFLYITHRGLLCVEVKGGKSIGREAGTWYSVSQNDQMHIIQDPFKQVQECSYALREHLRDVYGKKSVEAGYTLGYAVVFPECIFTGSGNDLITEVMFDNTQDLNTFHSFLERCFDYWEEGYRKKRNRQPQPLSDMQIKKLVDLLCGDFAVVPSINLEMQHIEQQFHILTEEQFDALETINMNSRVVITGGAGTGKTLIAIEKAKRAFAEDKKVAFICYNRNIANMVQRSIDAPASLCFVGTYHAFLMRYLTDITDWQIETATLAKRFLQASCEVEEYDYLIVDEAQDLMIVNVWDSLSKFIKGGMERGKWCLFLDPHQNMYNSSEEYDFAMEYLREVYSPAIIPLTLNCRNTEQIGRLTTQITQMSPAKHMKILGPEATIRSYASQRDLVRLLKAEVTSLLKGGCLPKDIVILSKYRFENSDLADIKSLCNLPINNAGDISNFSDTAINYFTIHSYKGLESKIIFLVDINGFDAPKNRVLNYVAMTRAQILLFVFYREDAHEEYASALSHSKDKEV
ncbi:MAG: NERD domain-containing protein [Peptococcaceae bacterium]|nr:NERD domain-containing protein [Peptococcaceae bacterium]